MESLKVVLINMIPIFIMSAKLATLGPLKINVFWKNLHDVVISVHEITNKISSRDSNYIVDVFMRPKLGNFNISAGEAIITSIL